MSGSHCECQCNALREYAPVSHMIADVRNLIRDTPVASLNFVFVRRLEEIIRRYEGRATPPKETP